MIRLIFILFPTLLSLLSSNSLFGQENVNFTEGYIVFDVKPAGNSDYSEFFRETTLTLYIKGEKSKLDLKIMGGFADLQFLDSQKSNSIALINLPMFSDKVSIPMSGEQPFFNPDEFTHVNRSPAKAKEIEIFPKDKERIAGKKSYKAIVPINNSRQKAAFYLAQNLHFNTPEIIKKHFGELPGVPLQAEFNFRGQRIVITAKEIRRTKINDKVFEIPDDYKNKTYEDLKNELENFNDRNDEKGL